MSNEIVKQPERLPVFDDSEFDVYIDTAKFEMVWRVANMFAKSDLVPSHYRGKPENCMIAFQSAKRLGIAPDAFMQKSFIIQGKVGMEAQLVIALVNARGPFKGPIQYKMTGSNKDKTRVWTAYAEHKVTGELCEASVDWKIVEGEGWSKKAGSKWLTMPDQMGQYRAATFLARLYAPEAILGFSMVEELQDIEGNEHKKPSPQVSSLEERLTKPVESVVSKPEQPKEEIIPPKETPESTEASNDTGESGADPEQPPATTIAPSERWYCKNCDEIFAEPKGEKIKKCPKCLSTDIVDRMAK